VSYANIIKCLAGVALTVVCMKMLLSEDSCESGNGVMHLKFYSVLNLFALMIYCCGSFIPEVSRIGYYFLVSQVFLIPGLLIRMENKKLKVVAIIGFTLFYILYFALFLRSANDVNVRILPYLSWIFD
ncbi:MAG: EpsG family protein, partial [Lachnospiraceae bacterium]|nr:EpsG family protein [Lachnospiraceae bacterium]